MLLDQVLNPGPLAVESDALQTALWNGMNEICNTSFHCLRFVSIAWDGTLTEKNLLPLNLLQESKFFLESVLYSKSI